MAQDLPLTVLHEDADLLVLDKAAGMVVHPARGSPSGTVVNALLHRLGEGAPGGERLGLVHRLDKETSGCLVVAKRAAALAALQAAFKARAVEKTYLALVHGAPADEGRLDTPYGRHPRDRTRYTGRASAGRRAVTGWRVRERFGESAALLEVALETGRTHQIRVHLSEAGHPLLADAVYGGRRREARLDADDPVRLAAAAIGRQALHAWRLAFGAPAHRRAAALRGPAAPGPAGGPGYPAEGGEAGGAGGAAIRHWTRIWCSRSLSAWRADSVARSGSTSSARSCTSTACAQRPRSTSTEA